MPMKVERMMFNGNRNIFPTPFEFRRHGESGIPTSNLFPHVATCADDLAVIRSMTSQGNEHSSGNYFMHTGFTFGGHPSAGAWISYGLGTQNANLPGFVVLRAGQAIAPIGGPRLFSSAYLPAEHQASVIQADKPEPVPNIRPRGSDSSQRARLRFIGGNDRRFIDSVDGNEQIEAAVRNYETAYRMQGAVPELCDLRGESEATKKLYGLDSKDIMKVHYARQCLLARRLVERGVRFIALSCLSSHQAGPNSPWDQHGQLEKGHRAMAFQVDQPIAGLLKDL